MDWTGSHKNISMYTLTIGKIKKSNCILPPSCGKAAHHVSFCPGVLYYWPICNSQPNGLMKCFKFICISHLFWKPKCRSVWKFTPTEDKGFHNARSQYPGCWWPGSTRNQDISSHNIDLGRPECSNPNTGRVGYSSSRQTVPRSSKRDTYWKSFASEAVWALEQTIAEALPARRQLQGHIPLHNWIFSQTFSNFCSVWPHGN